MATKGASNRYNNSRGGKKNKNTSNISYEWAKDFNKKTLKNHFDSHGSQVNTMNINSYAAHAVKFANTIDKKYCVSFIDEKESTHKYNKKTNEYAVIKKDGYIVTYYKPEKGFRYYLDQKAKRKKGGR